MTAASETITLRPTRTLRAMSAVATVIGVAAVVSVVLAQLAGVAALVVAAALGSLIAVIGVRHQLSKVDLTEDGAVVRNTFRSREVAWDQVARTDWLQTGGFGALTILAFSGKARFVLHRGRRLNLSATTVLSSAGARTVTAALRRTAGRAGIRVEPAGADGGPPRPTA